MYLFHLLLFLLFPFVTVELSLENSATSRERRAESSSLDPRDAPFSLCPTNRITRTTHSGGNKTSRVVFCLHSVVVAYTRGGKRRRHRFHPIRSDPARRQETVVNNAPLCCLSTRRGHARTSFDLFGPDRDEGSRLMSCGRTGPSRGTVLFSPTKPSSILAEIQRASAARRNSTQSGTRIYSRLRPNRQHLSSA